MRVKIKKLNENAKIPTQVTKGDMGYDVYAISEREVAPDVWEYELGFAYEIERGEEFIYSDTLWTIIDLKKQYWNICLDFRPRSSIWKTGMVLSNSVGTLDEFYRGGVKAYFYHVNKNLPRYKVGDKIGQIMLNLTLPLEFVETDTLTETERGEGGFGSSGK